MPGCAGEYLNPIVEWILEGKTCSDCAWETFCEVGSKEKDTRVKRDIFDDNGVLQKTSVPVSNF